MAALAGALLRAALLPPLLLALLLECRAGAEPPPPPPPRALPGDGDAALSPAPVGGRGASARVRSWAAVGRVGPDERRVAAERRLVCARN
ncbi:Protein of unknown function [Gryllus bimaculatus]|nr:Protein of unknown function [Gryllus bimaculatus]